MDAQQTRPSAAALEKAIAAANAERQRRCIRPIMAQHTDTAWQWACAREIDRADRAEAAAKMGHAEFVREYIADYRDTDTKRAYEELAEKASEVTKQDEEITRLREALDAEQRVADALAYYTTAGLLKEGVFDDAEKARIKELTLERDAARKALVE